MIREKKGRRSCGDKVKSKSISSLNELFGGRKSSLKSTMWTEDEDSNGKVFKMKLKNEKEACLAIYEFIN